MNAPEWIGRHVGRPAVLIRKLVFSWPLVTAFAVIPKPFAEHGCPTETAESLPR
jgi:hypothetical protein